MRYLQFQSKDAAHAAKQMAAIGRVLRSLDSVFSYEHAIAALCAGDIDAAEVFFTNIVTEAVPEEGDPHPRRATVRTDADGRESWAVITTPGCVEVTIRWCEDHLVIHVDMGRDSVCAAACICAALAYSRLVVDGDDNGFQTCATAISEWIHASLYNGQCPIIGRNGELGG